MATVVFLRAANAGRNSRFRPAAVAEELSAFGVVNVGAAGTFIVQRPASQVALRAELLRCLPFSAEIMFCPGRDLISLVSTDPFSREASPKGARRFLSLLSRRPPKMPRTPFIRPEGTAWQVKVVGLQGRFALSLWRRMGKALMYPTEVLEKELGIPVTTRHWDTIAKVCDILRRG